MNELFWLFLIILIGLLIGKISLRNISLGLSAVMLTALVFGHFGVVFPSMIKDVGLALFIGATGILSGPAFFHDMKGKAVRFIIQGILMVVSSAIICALAIRIFKLPLPLSLGLLAGSLSSTPCLAGALEVTGDPLVSVGYGIAYPFGVLGAVLLVQIINKTRIFTDEDAKDVKGQTQTERRFMPVDYTGISILVASICAGILLGRVSVPLPGGLSFSFGIAGGVLISGLFIGWIAERSFTVNRKPFETIRNLGLILFLTGAGTEAGRGFAATVNEYGIVLFLFGIVMTAVPIACGLLLGIFVFRMDRSDTLGSICGGMTSTAALGSLSETDHFEKISSAYAATYSFALITIVIAVQILATLFN